MPKRKCTLTDILKKEYPFLAESDNGKVLCTVCRAHFSIEHGGRSDITQHIAKKKHKEAAAAKSDSHKLTSWMTSQDALNERKVLAVQEGLMAFHIYIENNKNTWTLTIKIHKLKFKQTYNKKKLMWWC